MNIEWYPIVAPKEDVEFHRSWIHPVKVKELEPGEQCDGAAKITCANLGLGKGNTFCDSACKIDSTNCDISDEQAANVSSLDNIEMTDTIKRSNVPIPVTIFIIFMIVSVIVLLFIVAHHNYESKQAGTYHPLKHHHHKKDEDSDDEEKK
jgi:hypothetical protein